MHSVGKEWAVDLGNIQEHAVRSKVTTSRVRVLKGTPFSSWVLDYGQSGYDERLR